MEFKNLILKKENGIGFVTINRPKALNALNSETLTEIGVMFDQIENDDEIRVVILTGSGEKSFVAGADISEMKDKNGMEGRKFGLLGNSTFRKIETLSKPVIAAVNGFALGGGCEISMACDIRIASANAKFSQPEVGLGIMPGFGGTQRLARLVGMGMAKEMIYTTRMIDSKEAYRIGLVNKVVEQVQLLEEATKLAKDIMKNAPIGVMLSKQAINRGMQVDMDTAINFEAELFGACFSTEDQTEGMDAFLTKRKEKSFKNR